MSTLTVVGTQALVLGSDKIPHNPNLLLDVGLSLKWKYKSELWYNDPREKNVMSTAHYYRYMFK